MKSIKEKSEDVFPDHCDDSVHDMNIKMRIGFGAGANYVLEEVEKILSKLNVYKDGSDHTILYLDIKFLIEQLKK